MAVPIISVAQMREWEKATWDAGIKEADVINKVGAAIADYLARISKDREIILFLAGSGHNGDDTRAAQKHLTPRRPTILLNVTNPENDLPKVAQACGQKGIAWVVDGLFGVGLNRPLDAAWQKLIEAINGSDRCVLAVDVPSGINADTGRAEGAAIRATTTLTVGAPKCGLLKAIEFVGRLEVATDVGLVPYSAQTDLLWTLDSDFANLPPPRPLESNKGTFGHAVIIAGSDGYHGAAVLAGHGASRARPGLVTVFPQDGVYLPVAAQFQSVMVHRWRAGQELPKTCSALLCGPGLAAKDLPDTVKEELRTHWRKTPLPMVADASALDWLEPGATPDKVIRVITPHPGEAGRVLGSSAAAVQADRLTALRELSKRLGNCIVVLKGHQTLVGRSSGPVYVNNSGNPFLAQGGSGDLLGGYLTGLLAQSTWQKYPLTTARYAVWQHGATADHLSKTSLNWTVDDLSLHLGCVKGG
jgi:NAD(P)H-hydrate epimerase